MGQRIYIYYTMNRFIDNNHGVFHIHNNEKIKYKKMIQYFLNESNTKKTKIKN